jgi:hypothetical protein
MKIIDGPMAPAMKSNNGNQPNSNQPAERVLLSWDGFTFERGEIGIKWYAVASIITIALVGFFIWKQDWFSVVITLIVSAVLFWYVRYSKPEKVSYKVTALGLYINDRLYPFSEIHSFWLVYNQAVKKLNVVFTRKYLPAVQLDVNNIDPVILKTVLLRRIPEQEKRTESLVDMLVRKLGL